MDLFFESHIPLLGVGRPDVRIEARHILKPTQCSGAGNERIGETQQGRAIGDRIEERRASGKRSASAGGCECAVDRVAIQPISGADRGLSVGCELVG